MRSPVPRTARRQPVRKRLLALIAGGLAVAAAAGGMSATAAVPAFPNNLVVFPDRDFITVEGYQNHLGETALVEVTRSGRVIGSAKAVVNPGDVAFEINHPGGACWGDGTGVNVTPDIRPGDKVNISFNGIDAGDTTVADAFVTHSATASGDTLTVKGYVAPGVNTAQMEQRIINPDLVDTDIGRRDIRAVPGPLTPAPRGGYSSALTFEGDTFTATYVFQDPANAAIAARSGGERAMTWQEEDADGNRQGLTIAEFGEPGGPGMGGCPAGPADQGAPQPGTASVVRSTDKTSASVTWLPAEAAPGAAPVTAYSVEAIQQTASGTGERTIVGKRASASATHVNIDGLDPAGGYDVEVRSLAGPKMSEAFTVQVPSAPPTGDQTKPALTVTPANSAAVNTAAQVTLASEVNADIYYTTDGTPAIDGGLPSDTALHYTAPIEISKQVTIHAVAFDRAGNFDTLMATYKPPADTSPAPSAITAITGTAGQASVTLSWASSEPGVTGFGVQAYVGTTKVGALRETTAKTMTISGLTAGTDYMFTVKAKNSAGYGPESTPYGPLTPTRVTDTVSITSAKWKSGDFRVVGTGSLVGAIVNVRPALASGAIDRTRSLGSAQLIPAVAPATGGTYDVRMRNAAAPPTNPGKVYVESDSGGVAGPFVVTNG